MCPRAHADFITFIVLSIVNDKTVLQVTMLYTLSCQCLLQMVSTKLSANVTLPKATQTPIMYLYTRKSSTILVGVHNNHVTAYLMVLVTSIILAYKTHDRPWSGLQCLAVIFQTCKFSNMWRMRWTFWFLTRFVRQRHSSMPCKCASSMS